MKKLFIAVLLLSILATHADAVYKEVSNSASNISGTLLVANGGTGATSVAGVRQTVAFPVTATSYQSFGDSITYGYYASPLTDGYAYLISNDANIPITNSAISGEQACDQNDQEVFPYANPNATNAPVYTMMIGTNDIDVKGIGAYEAVFKLCHQAAISWLTVPLQYKVIGQAPTSTTGTWANGTQYGGNISLYSIIQGSTATYTITTTGGPIYVWYGLNDNYTGIFTYSVDGAPAITVNAFTNPPMAPQNGDTQSVGLIRIPNVAAGTHTVVFQNIAANNGNLSVTDIIALGTPPAFPYYRQPRLFNAIPPLQNPNDGKTAAVQAYSADVLADIALLAGDGLPIYPVNPQNYVNNSTDLYDNVHPNNTGHRHLADAFEAVMQFAKSNTNQVNVQNGSYTLQASDGFVYMANGGTLTLPAGLAAAGNPGPYFIATATGANVTIVGGTGAGITAPVPSQLNGNGSWLVLGTSFSSTWFNFGGQASSSCTASVSYANYTLSDGDCFVYLSGSGITLTLPNLNGTNGNFGGPYFINNYGNYPITITVGSGTLYPGIPSVLEPNTGIILAHYGPNWFANAGRASGFNSKIIAMGAAGWSNTGLGTSEENLVSVPIPAMGANDALRISTLWTRGGTLTDTDNLVVRLGTTACTPQTACSTGTAYLNLSGTTSSQTTYNATSLVSNRNSTSSQVVFNNANGSTGASSGAVTTGNINTGGGSYVNIDCTTATSSADSCKLESYMIELLTPN